MEKKLIRAVFLDRDGTLNRMVHYPEHGTVDSPFVPRQMKLIAGVLPALRMLRKKGFALIVVSNQPGVAKGSMTMKTFQEIDKKFDSLLAGGRVKLDAKYYCMHHPEAKLRKFRKKCACRKPKAGLITAAAKKHGIDLRRSYMAGDGIVDVKAGRAAGCGTIFIGHFKPELWKYFGSKDKPDMVAKNLLEAARKLR